MNKIKDFFEDWTKFEKGLLTIATLLMVVLSIVWKDTPIGLISSVTGIVSVILCAKGRVSNYVFGMIYVTAYALVAYRNKFYGEVMMNLLYYVPMNIIGFIAWTKAKKKAVNMEEKEVETRHMTAKGKIVTIIVALIAIYGYYLLLNYMGGSLAFIDSCTTIVAIIAMYLQVTRYTESWIMWILSNLISIGLWAVAMVTQGSNNITMLLMWSAYLVNSIYGYINWKKLERIEKKHVDVGEVIPAE